ncbi:MAG TPA: sigma-70 family RNA polymerase sigma factor [Isosphaeraceae bacterium]|nr:sigma-70 family RNA polymerase sigma factor [Isosphaeraceae bacterium]
MTDQEEADPEGWVDRHGDGLYRFALLRLRSPDLAADVVQETFLEALRARGSFAGRSSERTWLIGILRHKIVDHIRRSGREPATVNGVSSNGAEGSPFDHRGHWRVGPAAWAGNPSQQMETKEFWDVFGQCLSKLPKGLADAFFLRELDGLSAEEVQHVLGITPANFWKRLHRARSHLRQCLESSWFGQRTNPSSPSLRGPSHS